MRKIIALVAVLIFIASSAMAQHRRHHRMARHHYRMTHHHGHSHHRMHHHR